MAALYQLAVLGSPTDAQISELEEIVGTAVGMFNLRLGHEVGWEVRPEAWACPNFCVNGSDFN